ncbi:MAG: hypothetical protein IT383_22340 [Deltaproteobacteria bacterium]|nr:hypothetical protein [Deltaproteobacteria bacterium]
MPDDTPPLQLPGRVELTPIDRVAAVLLALGPEVAAPILQRLPADTVHAIARAARRLDAAPDSLLDDAAKAFVAGMTGYGTERFTRAVALREMVEKVLGPEGTAKALAPTSAAPGRLQELLAAEPADLAVVLEKEQVTTSALVVALLPPERAAAVVQALPMAIRGDLLRLASSMKAVSEAVVDDVVSGLADEIRRYMRAGKRRSLDGNQVTIALLRKLKTDEQRSTIAEIERKDPQLAETLRGKLISFEDLARLTKRELQTFLQSCDARTLAVALKGAPDTIADVILGGMSQRAAAALREEIELLGRVRIADIEAAQADLIKIVMKLADEGKVVFDNGP